MIAKSYEIERNINKFLNYNLFLLHGENQGLKREIKELIQSEINKKNPDIEHFSFYENEIIDNEENFYNSIFSGSLFGNKKIIVIKNSSDKINDKLSDVIEKFPENVHLVLFAEILEKKSKLRNLFEINNKTLSVACYPDNAKSLEIIAKTILRKNKINISQESINLLVEQSNGDRNNLNNEIEKIKSLSLDNKKIQTNELKTLTNFSGEYKTDSIVNECLCGNILEYKKHLSEMYTNTVNQIFLLRILSNKIQRLLNMKEMQSGNKNLDSLLNECKPPIFWKEKPLVKKQLTIWGIGELKKTNNEISHIEMMCKKNPQISKIIFFNFISEVCKKANSFS